MSNFYVMDAGRVYSLTVTAECSNEDVTRDFVALYETDHGPVVQRMNANEECERGYSYVIARADFLELIEYLEAMAAAQDEATIKPVDVWTDCDE